MTVFRPSLPPVSWTTTRMFSPPAAAARADALNRNCGTVGARATRAVEENAPLRKLRREVCMAGLGLCDARMGDRCSCAKGGLATETQRHRGVLLLRVPRPE